MDELFLYHLHNDDAKQCLWLFYMLFKDADDSPLTSSQRSNAKILAALFKQLHMIVATGKRKYKNLCINGKDILKWTSILVKKYDIDHELDQNKIKIAYDVLTFPYEGKSDIVITSIVSTFAVFLHF
jgi:hypothetical protein